MKRILGHVLVLLTTLGAAGTARLAVAQEASSFERQQRQYEEQLRQQLDFRAQPASPTAFDWGGWFNFAFLNYEDLHDEGRVLRRYDLFLWGQATLQQSHTFYVRTRLSLLDFNHGDSPDGREDDIEGPKLDRAYYQYDLRQATLRREKKNLPYNAFVRAGRQYVQFGTGLALSMPMDAVWFGGEVKNVEVAGLLGRTIESWDNIDRSPAVADDSRRDFYGVQATYLGIDHHRPFVYYLWQQDHSREDPADGDQEYDYDSEYLGLGSRGRLFIKNLYYETEMVFERGRSFGYGSTADQDHIHAMAYDLTVNYLFPHRCKPTAAIEYLFATGDDNRYGSPTNTIGGNRPGTTDTGFNAFGFRNTGLSFAPSISNLHMFRVGGTVKPLPDCRPLRELLVGSDVFVYIKDESAGAGADRTSTKNDRNLGQEVDLFCNWRITSDLLWTVRYGVFFPGDAYDSTRSARHFLFTGFTFSF